MNKAETKLVKVGESSACNDGANPEPSSSQEQACVETRRRVCIKCNKEIDSSKYKSSKYCSTLCRSAAATQRYRLKHNLIKNPGVGSGNNQGYHETHATWKDGIGTFKQIAFEHYPKICNRCGSDKNICVHHIDENRHNNVIGNLEVLCKKCHQTHHCKRDLITGQYIKG